MKESSKNKLDARKIFDHAGKFQWSYEHLKDANVITPEQMQKYAGDVAMVVSALATELYLKCLLVDFGASVEDLRTHNLLELYGKLPEQVQTRLYTLWDQDIWEQHKRFFISEVEGIVKEDIPRHLPTALKFGANTFMELRYVYEQSPRNINNILMELPELLRRVIAEIHTDWLVKK